MIENLQPFGSLVTANPGPTPGALGEGVFPGIPTYVLRVVGSGIGAVNAETGNTDFSTSAGDHAPVFQQAVNNLCAAGGPTAGQGGNISFKGEPTFNTQLTLFPGIALQGTAGCGGGTLASILSTFNGSAILLAGDARASLFHVSLTDFELISSGTGHTAQNGIEINDSTGSNLKDIFMNRVFIDLMGQHGLVLKSAATKVFVENSEFENCVGNGIDGSADTGSTLSVVNSYVAGNGKGYQGGPSYWVEFSGGTRFASNAGGAVLLGSGTNTFTLDGCHLDGNGGGATPQLACPAAGNGVAMVGIGGVCTFKMTAGGITNHITMGSGFTVRASIEGNHFFGHTGDAIAWVPGTAVNQLIIRGNRGYNDVKGKIANPFRNGRIGAGGNAAAPTASTAYAVEGTDLMLAVSGGTGVSITITDAAANTVVAGLATYTSVLPIGYTINFGAFTVAPTVYAGVI